MSNKFSAWCTKHEPDILTYVGAAGLLFSIGWSIKATFDASKALEHKKQELNRDKLTFKEVASTTWKYYLPVAISTAISVPCVIAGNHISGKRNAALALAYTGAESALQLTKDKLVEVAGPKTARAVKDAVAQEQVKQMEQKDKPASNNIVIVGEGDQMFFEPLSGRYFKSKWSKLEHAAYQLNEASTSRGSGLGIIGLNDWFEAIGLDDNDAGELLCWAPETLGGNGSIRIEMSTVLGPDNQACGSIEYKSAPIARSELNHWR